MIRSFLVILGLFLCLSVQADVGSGASDPACASLTGPFTMPAPVESLYVADDSGSYGAADGSSCASAFDGFAAIQWGAGAGKVSAGDALYLCGNFTGEALTIGAVNGTSNAPILVTSADADNPSIIDGGNSIGNLLNNGSGARIYFKFSNIILRNSTSAGFNTAGNGPIWVDGLVAYDNAQRGIYLLNQSSATVSRNTSYSNGFEGIRESTSGTGTSANNIIECNTVYDNPTQSIRASSVSRTYQVTNGIIRYNTAYNSGDGIYVIDGVGYRLYGNKTYDNTDTSGTGEGYGIAFQACTNCWAYSNSMTGNRFNGIESWGNNATPQIQIKIFDNYLKGNNPTSVASQCQIDINNGESGAVSGGSDVEVFGNVAVGACALLLDHDIASLRAYNNTLIGTSESTDLSTLFVAAGAHDTTVKNNYIYSAGTEYAFWSADAGVTGTFTHTNNSYFRAGGGTVIRSASTDYTTATAWESTALQTDPKDAFVFWRSENLGEDFRLSSSSPLRRVGADLNTGNYPDYEGRAFSHPPSIGAWEATSGDTITNNTRTTATTRTNRN